MGLQGQECIRAGPISAGGARRAAGTLKSNKAAGPDGVAAEWWKALLAEAGAGADWAVALCQACWAAKRVPAEWRRARVAPVYKKGDATDANNYRRIAALQDGYRLFAQILLSRLKEAGPDANLWPRQFGFRKGRSTEDALFWARRFWNDSRKSEMEVLPCWPWSGVGLSAPPFAHQACSQLFVVSSVQTLT